MFSALIEHYAGPIAGDGEYDPDSAEAVILMRYPFARQTLQERVMAFTDGACVANGRPEARAGYAAVIFGGVFSRGGSSWEPAVVAGRSLQPSSYYGAVAPHRYRFRDARDPSRGVEPVAGPGAETVPATNNRAELLGIITAMALVLGSGAAGPVEINSDSKISVRTFNEWLPARRRAGTAKALQNFDLLELGEALLAALAKRPGGRAAVVLQHCEAHRAEPVRVAGNAACEAAWLAWYGNDLADREAGWAIKAAPARPTTKTGLDLFAEGAPGEEFVIDTAQFRGEAAPGEAAPGEAAPAAPPPVDLTAAEAALAELMLSLE